MSVSKTTKTAFTSTITVLSFICFGLTLNLINQNTVPTEAFTNFDEYHLRYRDNIPGGLVLTGNTNGITVSAQDEVNFDLQNDSIGMFTSLDNSLQVESYPAGTTDDWRLNGSSAVLDFPANSEVVYAQLTWGGRYAWGQDDLYAMDINDVTAPITFGTPSGKQPVSADPVFQYFVDDRGGNTPNKEYSFTADVTNLVAPNGVGTYSVEGIPALLNNQNIDDASPDNIANWNLAVVYRNFDETIKNISVFSGTQENDTDPIVIEGFGTPLDGEVSGKLFIAATEGDASLSGDQLKFGETQNNLENLEGPNNPRNNFFRSQINNSDGEIDTRGSFGDSNSTGNSQSNLARHSIDITSIDVSEYLDNGQTQAYIQPTSDGEEYTVTTVGMQIEINAPNIVTTIAVDKPETEVGDILTYTVTVLNPGTTESNNTVVFADIPEGTSFVPNSLSSPDTFTGDNPLTGLDFGDLAIDGQYTFIYQVQVDSIPDSLNYVNRARTEYTYQMVAGSEVIVGLDLSNTVITTTDAAPEPTPDPTPVTVITNDDVVNNQLDQPIFIDVVSNDSIPDGDSTLVISSQPLNGVVSVIGESVTYTPNDGFTGTDTFVYTVCVGDVCDSATVTVNTTGESSQVLGANDNQQTPIATPVSDALSNTQTLVRSGGVFSQLLLLVLFSVAVIGSVMTIVGLNEPEIKSQFGEY